MSNAAKAYYASKGIWNERIFVYPKYLICQPFIDLVTKQSVELDVISAWMLKDEKYSRILWNFDENRRIFTIRYIYSRIDGSFRLNDRLIDISYFPNR